MQARRRVGRTLVGVAALMVVAVAAAAGLALASIGRRPMDGSGARGGETPSAATTSSAPGSNHVTTATETTRPPSLDAYRGLASWVDIYDTRAWKDPAAAVRDMASHGVRTIFLETANSSSPSALENTAALQTFIVEAHARDMRMVAWYLPDLKRPAVDYERIVDAILLQAPDGQVFDSFALDIESGAVTPVAERNRVLEALSGRIRDLVGPSYPLGAIIPSPVGLTRKRSYWSPFPYTALAGVYDVFVPMGYYTYHGKGGPAAYADTLGNVRIIPAQEGCALIPVHLIGGLAGESSPAEVAAFVRASRETTCVGAGLYDWATTSQAQWQELRALAP